VKEGSVKRGNRESQTRRVVWGFPTRVKTRGRTRGIDKTRKKNLTTKSPTFFSVNREGTKGPRYLEGKHPDLIPLLFIKCVKKTTGQIDHNWWPFFHPIPGPGMA